MMHTLIVGARGVGKSTLIAKVLREIDRPVSGFRTRKETHLADPVHGDPIYFYEAAKPQEQRAENLLGYCLQQHPEVYPDAFDRVAPKVLQSAAQGDLILMDEIGFMEEASECYCAAILSVLDGKVPAIAAVKMNDNPFLNAVRIHPNCRCFYVTEENRDALFPEVLAFVREQMLARPIVK